MFANATDATQMQLPPHLQPSADGTHPSVYAITGRGRAISSIPRFVRYWQGSFLPCAHSNIESSESSLGMWGPKHPRRSQYFVVFSVMQEKSYQAGHRRHISLSLRVRISERIHGRGQQICLRISTVSSGLCHHALDGCPSADVRMPFPPSAPPGPTSGPSLHYPTPLSHLHSVCPAQHARASTEARISWHHLISMSTQT